MGRNKRSQADDFSEFEEEPPRGARERDKDNDREEDREFFETDPTWAGHVPQEEWPDGMEMRWISIQVTGADDNKNWSVKTAAKWTPVERGKYPKIDARFPHVAMPGSGSGLSQSIIFGGLCLCERDRRYGLRDKRAQAKATEDAGRTIENYVEGGNANFPRFNQSQPAQFERGKAQFKE